MCNDSLSFYNAKSVFTFIYESKLQTDFEVGVLAHTRQSRKQELVVNSSCAHDACTSYEGQPSSICQEEYVYYVVHGHDFFPIVVIKDKHKK